jgi:hypothetical protein
MSKLLRLLYGSLVVGEIIDPFCDQDTWFGSFRPTVVIPGNLNEQRLGEFVAFCEQWHDRLASGEVGDASDFDRFGDVILPGKWRTEDPDGIIRAIHKAPVFCSGEVTWHYLPGQSEPGGERLPPDEREENP